MRMSETDSIYLDLLKPIPRQDEIMSDIQKQIDDYAAQCNGTDNYYRIAFCPFIYTDGVKLVADLCGAYWLIDGILSKQRLRIIMEQEFQVWKLADIGHRRATLTCEDGNGNEVFREMIPFTDFPLDEIKFYVENGTLYLPCER